MKIEFTIERRSETPAQRQNRIIDLFDNALHMIFKRARQVFGLRTGGFKIAPPLGVAV